MPADLWAFREGAGRAAAKADRGCTVGDADRYTPIADAVIAEFAKPTDAMIDAAYEAIRFDEDWGINSRRALSKAVKAMVCVPTRRHKQLEAFNQTPRDITLAGYFARGCLILPRRNLPQGADHAGGRHISWRTLDRKTPTAIWTTWKDHLTFS